MTETINIEEIVSAYMTLRTEKEAVTRTFEETESNLKSAMEILKKQLLGICSDMKVDSLKTSQGTVIRQLKEKFYAQDWDGFYKFVLEQESPQFLEKRVAQGTMKEYIAMNPDAGLPPGVNVFREYDISIRKPTGV